jgi:hypothetical protein
MLFWYSTVKFSSKGNVRCKLSKLVSYHILRYGNVHIALPIVYLKLQADKIWKYGRRARLRLDRCQFFACSLYDW